jgi:hypothetical protein
VREYVRPPVFEIEGMKKILSLKSIKIHGRGKEGKSFLQLLVNLALPYLIL